MKKILNYLFVVVVLVTAASCKKDSRLSDELLNNTAQLITCTFADSDSKATLDGVTPKWSKGDEIKLYDNASNSATVTVQDADDGKTSFSFEKPVALTGSEIYAVYPSSAANDMDGEKIGFKIPSSTDGTFANAHIAVAKGTTSLSFKNVVSLLKIATTNDIKGINISSTSNISGDYKVTYSSLAIENGASQTKSVSLSSSGEGIKYVAIPGEVVMSNLSFMVINNFDAWFNKSSTSTSSTAINKIYNLGKVEDWGGSFTDGALNGTFHVSPTTTVKFSKGNLKYQLTGGTKGWGFFDYQYNCDPGTDNKSSEDYLSLFCWGYEGDCSRDNTTYVNVTIPDGNSFEYTNDWGTQLPGSWRTLTIGEWDYLLHSRTFTYRFAKATLNSAVCGIIIFPDEFDGSSLPLDITISNANTNSALFTSNMYSLVQWHELETRGCVFLPAAGYRNVATMNDINTLGDYWSSTSHGTNSYNLFFRNDNIRTSETNSIRKYGYAVRLVKNT